MQDCIFCKIVKGKIPSFKVYEDQRFLAFLDISPLTKGHTLVIPKEHYRWVNDVPNFGEYFKVAKKIGKRAKEAFGADWICYLTLGLDVPHAHIHVIPRYPDDLHGVVVDFKKKEKFSEKEMKKIASKLKKAL